MNKLSGLQLWAANFRGSNSGDSVEIAILTVTATCHEAYFHLTKIAGIDSVQIDRHIWFILMWLSVSCLPITLFGFWCQ